MSPFPFPGVAAKYNGNLAIFPPPSSQSQQEVRNSRIYFIIYMRKEKKSRFFRLLENYLLVMVTVM